VGKRHKSKLTEALILAWADAHKAGTGTWPMDTSGPVAESPADDWRGIDRALRRGLRGLPGGSSLARLLCRQRGVRNHRALPALTEGQILAWADAHFARTGDWPTATTGPITDAPGETWMAVEGALQHGNRGLPGGDTLFRLLRRKHGLPERRGRHRGATPARLRQVLRLHGRGLSLAEVGRRLGVSRQAVQQMLRRAEAGARTGAQSGRCGRPKK
jgi:hypothetical protein